jgi:hypothetical protein
MQERQKQFEEEIISDGLNKTASDQLQVEQVIKFIQDEQAMGQEIIYSWLMRWGYHAVEHGKSEWDNGNL